MTTWTHPARSRVMLAMLLALTACSTPTAPPGSSSPARPQRATPAAREGASESVSTNTSTNANTRPGQSTVPPRDPAALGTERQWLQQWFKDTPVQIAQDGDVLRVEVPREFAFDIARNQIKPPLAAVLDKVAQSLRRLPQARLDLVAAPGDGAAASPLALQRATQVRKHLLSRGVPESQLGSPSAAAAAAVQLRLALASP